MEVALFIVSYALGTLVTALVIKKFDENLVPTCLLWPVSLPFALCVLWLSRD